MNREQRRKAQRDYRAQLVRPQDRAVIGIVSPGELSSECFESICNLRDVDMEEGARRLRRPWRLHTSSGANVSQSRNRVLVNFLALPDQPTWLLMVDTDMAFDHFALERLISAADGGKRIVGGLCFAYSKGRRISPTIFKADDVGRFMHVDRDEPFDIPNNTVLDVYGTGAAFLLVHRDALIKIAHLNPWSHNPWFREDEWWFPNPDHNEDDPTSPPQTPYWVSEDLYFCRKAWEAGIEVCVHTGVEVEHKKPHYLTRRLYESDYSALTWQAHRAEEEKAKPKQEEAA